MKFFINSYFGDNQSIGLLSHIKKRLPYGMDDQWMVFSHYTERGWTVDNLWHIFTDFYGGQYAPLAFLSYLVLYAGFGYDPFYFHMFSLLLHIGCVCLVWKLISSLLRVHGGVSEKQILYVNFITTLLFAVHPINVEAVAWISALKVLLYAFFLSLGATLLFTLYTNIKDFLLCINDRVLSLFFLGKGTGCYFSTGIVDRRLVYEPEYEKS